MIGSKKFEIGLFILVLLILVVVWAVNGYEDTWFYVIVIIIAIPIGWYDWSKKDKSK